MAFIHCHNCKWSQNGFWEFSFIWKISINEIRKVLLRIKHMHWWTYNRWKKDPDRWICPKCGIEALDID